ncbi:MAG: hypothetical protein J6K32_12865 [Clostridia bacterium]|nr:hypothetical protein [Clostridia bacterium]
MTADERIEKLLKRAGGPVMIVHSDAPATEERHMAHLIDRMEAALENVIIERDGLIEEIRGSVTRCDSCAHSLELDVCIMAGGACRLCRSETCGCRDCVRGDKWKWRGPKDADA